MKKILFLFSLVLIFSSKVFAGDSGGAVGLDVVPELPAQEAVADKNVVREEFFKALAELLKHEQEVIQLEKSRPGRVRRLIGGRQQEFDFEKAKYELEKARVGFCNCAIEHKINKQDALDYLKDYLKRAELDLDVKQALVSYVEDLIGQIEFGQALVEAAFSGMEKNQSEEEKEARNLIAKKAEEDFRNYVDSVFSKINKLSDLWLLRKKFYFCKSDVEHLKKLLIFENYIEDNGSTISPEGRSFLKGSITWIMQLFFVFSSEYMDCPIDYLNSLDYVNIVLRKFQNSRLRSSNVVGYFCVMGFYKAVDGWYSVFTG